MTRNQANPYPHYHPPPHTAEDPSDHKVIHYESDDSETCIAKKACNNTFDNLYNLHLILSLPLVVATRPPMFHSLIDCMQQSNASLSICVTDDGIKMAHRFVHPRNAPGPIISSLLQSPVVN